MNFGQIAAIQLMDQFNRCNFNNYLVVLDQAMSKLPQLVATVSNVVTQLITGNSNKDTAIYLAYNDLFDNYNNAEYVLLG